MSSNSVHQIEQPDERSNITRHGASWKGVTGTEGAKMELDADGNGCAIFANYRHKTVK